MQSILLSILGLQLVVAGGFFFLGEKADGTGGAEVIGLLVMAAGVVLGVSAVSAASSGGDKAAR